MATAASLFGQQLVSSLVPAYLGSVASGFAAPAVLSPLSVWFALILLLNGAGVPSSTYTELWQVVAGSNQFGSSSSSNSTAALAALNSQASALRGALARQALGVNTLTIADAVWTQGTQINPAYASSMKELFNAEVAAVPSATPINQWAARVTNGLITQVVPPSLAFNMVLTNAMYFKGVWEYPFDRSRTSTQAFAALTRDSMTKGCSFKLRGRCSEEVQVPMMARLFNPSDMRGTHKVAVAQVPGKYQAVRLPYKGSAGLAAVFVLPASDAFDSVFEGLRGVTGQMVVDPNAWSPLSEALAVTLPSFKVEAKQLSLKQALKSMGVRAPFDQADFSRAATTPLVLTDVLHSAVVQVDESGTEAAAATAAITLKSALAAKPPATLVFNRPFLFFLVDTTTQTVLFQGAITDPRGSS